MSKEKKPAAPEDPKVLKDAVVVTLQFPVKHGSEEIRELNFRRPKGKDMRKLPSDVSVGDIMDLAARLSGYPPSVMDELEIADFNAVNEVIGDFLGAGPKTGKS